MKVDVLIENTSEGYLSCEHGLSILIEYNGTKILLDAGSTSAFIDNADKLNIDLTEVKICVLSHGHYDHSGGFGKLLQINSNARVYVQRSAFGMYFSEKGGMHEISIPKDVLLHIKRFEQIQGFKEILPDIYLVPHSTTGLNKIGKRSGLYKEENGNIIPDDFYHEQSLVFDTPKGIIIFNSCSHGGVKNIINEVKKVCNNKRIYAYVGGLHMKGTINGEEVCTFSDSEIDSLCSVIINENITYIYTGHCTGICGFNKLKERLGNRLYHLTTGLSFEL